LPQHINTIQGGLNFFSNFDSGNLTSVNAVSPNNFELMISPDAVN